jgi:hypothetical protein
MLYTCALTTGTSNLTFTWLQTVALQNKAAAEATVFGVRQDEAADEPTHSRVIEHTEQLVSARFPASHRSRCELQTI